MAGMRMLKKHSIALIQDKIAMLKLQFATINPYFVLSQSGRCCKPIIEQKICFLENFALPLPSLTSKGLSCGVMVTQQILVLSFWVRVPAAQPVVSRSFDLLTFFVGDVLRASTTCGRLQFDCGVICERVRGLLVKIST